MIDLQPKVCNLCGGKVEYQKTRYVCLVCGAYVGTHKNRPKEAMGTLADERTRKKRIELHQFLDKFWRTKRGRNKAYKKLAEEMGIPFDECHFGYMNYEELEQAKQILLKWWYNRYDR